MLGWWILQYILSDTFVLFVIVLFLTKILMSQKSSKKQPPGPIGWPVLGHLPMLGRHPYKYLYKLWGKYGDIVQIQMGSRRTIVLNGYNACKEALVKQGEVFAGRPDFQAGKFGTFVNEPYTESTKLKRRIVVKALKRIAGSFAADIEELVNNQAGELVKELTSHTDVQDPRDAIAGAIAKVLFSLICGLKVDHRTNKDYEKLHIAIRAFIKYYATGGNIGDLLPWVNIFTNKAGFKKLKKIVESQESVCSKYIRSHLSNFMSNEIRDILDSLIQATNETNAQEKEDVALTDLEVLMSIRALFGAGLSTVATFLHWSVMYMAEYVNVQKKAQKEIDEVFEHLNCLRYSDRVHMPYVQACLYELMRITTVAPNAIPHATTKDTILLGYYIPKGTMVFPNLWSISREQRIWNNPEMFDPERFLIKSGETYTFNQTKADFVSVFGLGKRRCVGELLAKMEIFLIFVTLIKECSISKSDKIPLDFEPIFGLTLDTKPYKVLIKRRL